MLWQLDSLVERQVERLFKDLIPSFVARPCLVVVVSLDILQLSVFSTHIYLISSIIAVSSRLVSLFGCFFSLFGSYNWIWSPVHCHIIGLMFSLLLLLLLFPLPFNSLKVLILLLLVACPLSGKFQGLLSRLSLISGLRLGGLAGFLGLFLGRHVRRSPLA
jgi:hypothetical protein